MSQRRVNGRPRLGVGSSNISDDLRGVNTLKIKKKKTATLRGVRVVMAD
jgi:hypothetical protein